MVVKASMIPPSLPPSLLTEISLLLEPEVEGVHEPYDVIVVKRAQETILLGPVHRLHVQQQQQALGQVDEYA